jgi:tetratricopeptide (TPR) repeat protein
MKRDPKNPDIQEDHINQQGYQLLNSKNAPWGEALFKINTLLYPKSANVYDSYAEALRLTKNYKQSILNYRKSIALNPKNENARNMIKEMEKGE